MPRPSCRRCGYPLTPIYPGQDEHPLCSPTDTGWIPRPAARQAMIPAARPAIPAPLRVALGLAALGWHILPLSPASKRPLGNCPACRPCPGGPAHPAGDCPCIAAGGWCHGVRAATTDPATITAWWQREPRAVPGIAAGPSGLVLVDIDAHGDQLPPDLATGLLPGINLTAEPIPHDAWDDPARFRDGRDTLALLARLRGGPRPWPPGAEYQPVAVATPSGGTHLWYRASADGLRQALSDPRGRHGLAWQVDIKAGWSYGIAPGATTTSGPYRLCGGDLTRPGRMPGWLAREVERAATARPPRPAAIPRTLPAPDGPGPAAYLAAVLDRGAARLAALTDGRQRALSALAYHAGGLLAWSGLNPEHVTSQLTSAGIASGLGPGLAARIVRRALANGTTRPLTPPGHRDQHAV
jgi:hypothetical protein